MARNVLVDFRSKTAEELAAEIANMRRQFFGLRMQKATQQLSKSSELPRARRNIARALTVLRERELGIARAVAPAPAASETPPSDDATQNVAQTAAQTASESAPESAPEAAPQVDPQAEAEPRREDESPSAPQTPPPAVAERESESR